MEPLDIDPSRYPNITALERVGLQTVVAHLGPRRFRIWIYEKLSDRSSPLFSTNYEQRVEVRVADRWHALWVKVDLPWEARDSFDECMHAALRHVNGA